MDIRGVGDGAAMRRLLWLFLTTVLAPSILLGLMALGALGHQQWTAGELALQRVEVQLPHVARDLDAHTAQIDVVVRALAERCPAADCSPPEHVARWSIHLGAAVWEPDLPSLESWARGRVLREPDDPVEVGIADGGAGIALHGPLLGKTLDAHLPLVWSPTASPRIRLITATSMLALVVTGLVFGLGAAAREIAMSQRQIELVGRVSHELRTPLTSIGMFVEALREGRLDAERQAECLDLLSRETERLSRRIEEVLAWARMESGARRYHTTTVSVADVVQRAMDALRTAAMFEEAEGLDVTVDLPAQLPDLEVDPDAVVEALLNLLVNAWRHTEPPRVVRVTATARPRRVGISVSDNGPGISSRDRRRIFEKFYQPESDETRYGATRGTGLGLAIVRAIVRAHGGRVDLAPARDRGSTFTIWLPVAG